MKNSLLKQDLSVLFGNPCIIKHRDNATECYINRRAEYDN